MSAFKADGYTWDVMCENLDCLDEKVFTSREDAVATANRRTPGPATLAMVEQARKLIDWYDMNAEGLSWREVPRVKEDLDRHRAFLAEWPEAGRGAK